jgi:hypothetical protein
MSHYHEIFHQGISFNTPEHIERLQKYMYSGQPQIVELNTTVDLYRRTFETELPKGASFQNVGGNLVAHLNGVPFQMHNGVYEPCTTSIVQTIENRVLEKEQIIAKVSDPNETPHSQNSTLIFPNRIDRLFWAIYIGVHGMEQYQSIHNRYHNTEIEEKQKIVDFMKQSPEQFKQYNRKITKIQIQEMMSDLLTNKKTDISVLVALAAFYNKRIVIMKGCDNMTATAYPEINIKMVFDTFSSKFENLDEMNVETDMILLVKNSRGEYGVYTEVSKSKIGDILETYVKIENCEKPMATISKYKMEDLIMMAEMVGIDTKSNTNSSKKWKKAELYAEIAKLWVW